MTTCRCGHDRGDHARNEGECLDDACACTLFISTLKTQGRGRGVSRKYPEPKVGDVFGSLRVVAILPRTPYGRRDLRLALVCTCGKKLETYEYNVRRRKVGCVHQGRAA